ncbi:amidohydrolase family protein [Alloalcanivorax sp.]|uniref:amidohydrolase family protein n=1 Tax=Alloalcanivorax sp. TaxID=3020835 RepID=UPI00355A0385
MDAHLHYVDFMQQSDGSEAMLAAMDEAGVEDAWLFGLPVVKKWQQDAPRRPRYYLGDEAPLYYYSATDDIVAGAVRDLPEDQRRRLAPFISGFNPTDMNAARHVQALIERYPGLWRGIGEVITRHDDLTALTAGETARANHPALMKVYRLAARHDLPVLLHSNLTSLREETPIYLGELEDALRSNPDTRFVLAHAGTSGGVEKRQAPLATLNEIICALLERYNNLYVDLSWSVREHYLIKDGEPRAAWVALIEDHPDRFVLGSDVVGHFDSIGAILGEYRPLLDALPKPVADKLRAENARALLPERGAVAED